MTIYGLLFMILSWSFIIVLMVYSYGKIFAQDGSVKDSVTPHE